jgi:hypothetical protein
MSLWSEATSLLLEVSADGKTWESLSDRVAWSYGGISYSKGRDDGTLNIGSRQMTVVLHNDDGEIGMKGSSALSRIFADPHWKIRLRCDPWAGAGYYNMIPDGSFENEDVPLPVMASSETTIPGNLSVMTDWCVFWGGIDWQGAEARWTTEWLSDRIRLTQQHPGSILLQAGDAHCFSVEPGDEIVFTVDWSSLAGTRVSAYPTIWLGTYAAPWVLHPYSPDAAVYAGPRVTLYPSDPPFGPQVWTLRVPETISTVNGSGEPIMARAALFLENQDGVDDGVVDVTTFQVKNRRTPTLVSSTERAARGSRSLKVLLPGDDSIPTYVTFDVSDLLPGSTYLLSVKVYNEATVGPSVVRLTGDVTSPTGGATTSTTGQWVHLTTTYVHDSTSKPGLRIEGPWDTYDAGDYVWGYGGYGTGFYGGVDSILSPSSLWLDDLVVRPYSATHAAYDYPWPDSTFSTYLPVMTLWSGSGVDVQHEIEPFARFATIVATDALSLPSNPVAPIERAILSLNPSHYWPLTGDRPNAISNLDSRWSALDVSPPVIASPLYCKTRDSDTVYSIKPGETAWRELTLDEWTNLGTPTPVSVSKAPSSLGHLQWSQGASVGAQGPQSLRFLPPHPHLGSSLSLRFFHPEGVDPAPCAILFFRLDETPLTDGSIFSITTSRGECREIRVATTGKTYSVQRDLPLGSGSSGSSSWEWKAPGTHRVDDGQWHSIVAVQHDDHLAFFIDGGMGDTFGIPSSASEAWAQITIGGRAPYISFDACHFALFAVAQDKVGSVAGPNGLGVTLLRLLRTDLQIPTLTMADQIARWADPECEVVDPATSLQTPLVLPSQTFSWATWPGKETSLSDLMSMVDATEAGHLYASGGRLLLQSALWPVLNDPKRTPSSITVSFADLASPPSIRQDGRLYSETGGTITVTSPESDSNLKVPLSEGGPGGSLDTVACSLSDAQSVATWRLAQSSPLRPQWDSIEVDLLTLQRWTTQSPLLVDVGSFLTLTGLPSQYTGMPTDLLVTRVEVQITTDSWRIVLGTTSRDFFDLIRVGDALDSRRVGPTRGARAVAPLSTASITATVDYPDDTSYPLGTKRLICVGPVVSSSATMEQEIVARQVTALGGDANLFISPISHGRDWSTFRSRFLDKSAITSTVVPGPQELSTFCWRGRLFPTGSGYVNRSTVLGSWLIVNVDVTGCSDVPGATGFRLPDGTIVPWYEGVSYILASNASGDKRYILLAMHASGIGVDPGTPPSSDAEIVTGLLADPYVRVVVEASATRFGHRSLNIGPRVRDVFSLGDATNGHPGALEMHLRPNGSYKWWWRDGYQRAVSSKGKAIAYGYRYDPVLAGPQLSPVTATVDVILPRVGRPHHPAPLSVTAAFPAFSLGQAAIGVNVAIPSPRVGSARHPTLVEATAAVRTATPRAGGNKTAAVVAATVAVPSPQAGPPPHPAVVRSDAAVRSPVVSGGGTRTVTAPVAATVAVPSATKTTGATVVPLLVTTTVVVPAPGR